MAIQADPARLDPVRIRLASCGPDKSVPHIIRGLEHTVRPVDLLAREPAD